MKKYKLIENRPELSLKDIEQGMDFGKISSSAPKASKLAFSKTIALASAVTVVVAGVFAAIILNKGGDPKIVEAINKPMPLTTNDNPLKLYTVNTERDTTILHETGSLIKIPKGAFVDSTGKPVTGEVNVDYREFHNIGQIVLAGIPMTYDSAGVQSHFESAGMFEIHGSQNGHEVFIDPSKSLEVQMVSLNSDTAKFNKYFYDPAKNNWEYIAEDVPSIQGMNDEAKADSVRENIAGPAPQKAVKKEIAANTDLVKPIKKNNNKQQFTLDVDPGVYPELSVFNKIIFEVSSKTKNFDPADAAKNWYDAEIERIEKSGEYKITFKGNSQGQPTSLEVIGYPVVDDNEYGVAIKKYNQLSENYEKKLDQKKMDEAKEEGKLNDQLSQYVTAMNRYRQLVKENYQLINQAAESSQMVYRTFQVQRFGIFNSDCPQRMPQGLILAADFQNENGKAIEPVTIYLVEKGNNTLFTFYPGKPIYINPNSDNVLMVITKDNALGWVKNDAISGIDKSAKKHNFKMNTVRKTNYSMSDINNLLL